MPTSVKRITLAIPDREYAAWAALAQATGRTMAGMIREALRREIAAQGAAPTPGVGGEG